MSGEIAEDLTSYYAYSEQIPTVCALGVLVDTDLTIACAGGYLIQLLPGATDAEITQLEQNIAAMPSVTELLRAGKTPEDMMELALKGFNPNVLDERRWPTSAIAATSAPKRCCSVSAKRSWKSSATKTPTARSSATSATPSISLI